MDYILSMNMSSHSAEERECLKLSFQCKLLSILSADTHQDESVLPNQ